MAKGLPIITFNYSTEEMVQKRGDERPNKNCFQTPGMNDPFGTKTPSPRGGFDTLDDMNVDDKSLQSLVRLATQEIEEESHERKVIKFKSITLVFIS